MAKRRTAAQRAATRKLVALNKSRRGGAKRKTKRVRRNPIARASRRRSVARGRRRAAAPARRRMSRAVRRNPAPRRASRRVRRNPILPTRSTLMGLFGPALHGVGGSLVVDGVFGHLPLPAQFQTGYGRHATKVGLAVLLAVVGGRFFAKKTATQMGIGSLTVIGHEVARELAAEFVPQVNLDGMAMPVGAFVTGPGASGMGYISSAMNADANSGLGAFVTGPGAGGMSGMNDSHLENESSYYGGR